MVWGVCPRTLLNDHDAEDAHHCQLTKLLKKGYQQGYRQLCTQIIRPNAGITNPNVLNTVVWTCALAPDAT
jgi:hypothetical protein